MNILITSFSFPSYKNKIFDGKFVFSEAIAYSQNGANVKVITPYYHGADKIEKNQDRITIFRFQYFIPKSLQVLKRPGEPIYNPKSFLAFLQIPFLCFFFVLNILKHASWADIIHAQWTVTALLALPAKWFLGKKIVVTARGSDIRLLPKWMNRFIHYQVDGAIDCFGPQPRNIKYKMTFSAKYIKLPLIVHHDVSGTVPDDIKEIVCRKPGTFIILYIGRFDPIKITEDRLPLINLIYASKISKQRDMNFHVLYIGDGDDHIKRNMFGLINQHGLQNYVTLLGPKTDVFDYIKFSHLGVGGIAINAVSQEYTISGKAQILMKVKVNADTPWCHGVNAIFVKPDDPVDLAEKIIWAIKNPEQLKKIGENAKEDMKNYIVDSKFGGALYLKEFENLLNRS